MSSLQTLLPTLIRATDWVLNRSQRHSRDSLWSALIEGRTSGPVVDLKETFASVTPLLIMRDAHLYVGDIVSFLNYERLAEWLVFRAYHIGPEKALAALDRFLNREPLTTTAILALARVSVQSPISLGHGVECVPFSPQEFLGLTTISEVGRAETDVMHISAGLSVRFQHPVLCEESDSPERATTHSAAATLYWDALQRAYRALLIMGIVRPQPPALVGRVLLVSEDLPGTFSPSLSSHVEIDSAWPQLDLTSSEYLEAAALFDALERLPEDRRDDMLMPLRRLRSAMTETKDFANAAIDLGIAFESMLVRPEETNEVLYRLSMRGAAILGTTTAERISLRKRFAAIYAMRSSAAHRGGVPLRIKGSGGGNSDVLLHDGFRLAALTIKALLRTGCPDDLDELLLRLPPSPSA